MGGEQQSSILTFLPLIIIIAVMYFLMIRPQRKKDKEVQQMRNNIKVGDEIVTIGGICGKVVKVKDDSIVIQVGADKSKFEMKKWAIGSVVSSSSSSSASADVPPAEEKKMPKKLKKAEVTEDLGAPVEEPSDVE